MKTVNEKLAEALIVPTDEARWLQAALKSVEKAVVESKKAVDDVGIIRVELQEKQDALVLARNEWAKKSKIAMEDYAILILARDSLAGLLKAGKP